MRHTRFLVIGAGPTGLGAATRLTELGEEHVVVDGADRVGGMASSHTDPQGFTWDLGGHVIHSHFAEFDEAVRKSQVELREVRRNGFVWLGGRLVPAPVQQHLDTLPGDLRPDAPAANLADHYRNHFGAELFERFFEPFNRKMWSAPLELVDHTWTSLRSGSGAANVPALGLARDARPAVEHFPYPLGGTGALWSAVAQRLTERDRILLGTRVVALDVPARTARLSDGTRLAYEFAISTAPVTDALTWAGLPGGDALRASTVTAVGVGFDGTPPPALDGVTWVYCPDPDVPWYRLTVLSTYDPGNAGEGRWSVLCEIPSARQEDPVRATVASLVALGADASRVVSTWSRELGLGYPVPTLGRDDVLHAADDALRPHGVFSRGRFGGWRYESCNQDYAFVQGRQAVDASLFGADETAYWHPERY